MTKKKGNRTELRPDNSSQWSGILKNLFPFGIPKKGKWNNQPEIVDMLNRLASHHGSNFTFFPNMGWFTLQGASIAHEPDCIELDFGARHVILKPRELTFESFGPSAREWSYFRIDSNPLAPWDPRARSSFNYEELVEIAPGEYVDRFVLDQGFLTIDYHLNTVPLPSSSRLVMRYFSGSFVIFAKSSPYVNMIKGDDGRHSKMSPEEFRDYIVAAAAAVAQLSISRPGQVTRKF